jgi:hypothetical protein
VSRTYSSLVRPGRSHSPLRTFVGELCQEILACIPIRGKISTHNLKAVLLLPSTTTQHRSLYLLHEAVESHDCYIDYRTRKAWNKRETSDDDDDDANGVYRKRNYNDCTLNRQQKQKTSEGVFQSTRYCRASKVMN